MNGPTIASSIPPPGFADATGDSQHTFRAVLDALARPAQPVPLVLPVPAPLAFGAAMGAVALTVLDDECGAWLAGDLATDDQLTAWLAFHTGVRRAEVAAEADFVFTRLTDLPDLGALALGTDEEPHRSATVVVDVRDTHGPLRFDATGPGIRGRVRLEAPWAGRAFAEQWARNGRLFPRGVDLLLVGDDTVTGLPRTTRLSAPDPTHHHEEA